MGIIIDHTSPLATVIKGTAEGMGAYRDTVDAARDRALKRKILLAQQAREDAASARDQGRYDAQMQDLAHEQARRPVLEGQQDTKFGQRQERYRKGVADEATSEQDARTRQDAELGSLGGGTNEPSSGIGPPSPDGMQMPTGLDKELWPDYHRTYKALQDMKDPRQRDLFLQQKRAEWTQHAHMKSIDDLLKTIGQDRDDGSFEADPESGPDEEETKLLGKVGEYTGTLSELRQKVAGGQTPASFNIDGVAKAYGQLKSTRAQMFTRRRLKNESLTQLSDLRAQVGTDRKKSEQLGVMQDQIAAGLLKPEKAVEEATKLVYATGNSEPYGDGSPFEQAPPHARAAVLKEAWSRAHGMVAGTEDYKHMPPRERAAEVQALLPEVTKRVVEEYGWSNEPPSQAMPTDGVPGADQPLVPGEQTQSAQQPPAAPMQGFAPKAAPAASAPSAALSTDEQAHVQARRKQGWKDEDIAAELKQIRGSRP